MFTHLLKSARTMITVGIMALAMVGSSTAAQASTAYKVWFFDTNWNTYSAGDITNGWAKLQPPAWACGLRFYTPSYYRWVNSTGNTISSANFNKDVRVWIPKAGCPEPFSIEYVDNSASFPAPLGGSYMEIFSNYGVGWIDANGVRPQCVGCVGPQDLVYFSQDQHWADTVVSAFATISPSLLDSRTRSGAISAVGELQQRVTRLQLELQTQVANRRRVHLLGDLEPSVQAIEDAAQRSVDEALQYLNSCSTQAQQGRFTDAFAACTLGGERMNAAGSLLETAESTFRAESR
jgi:hypothetical protein